MEIKYFTWLVLFVVFILNVKILNCADDLYEEFGDLNPKNKRPDSVLGEKLVDAVYDGNLSKIKELVSQGASVNWSDKINGRSVLEIAIEKCNLPIIQYFFEKNAQIESNLLSTAIDKCPTPFGDIEVIKYLIEKDVKVNAKDQWG